MRPARARAPWAGPAGSAQDEHQSRNRRVFPGSEPRIVVYRKKPSPSSDWVIGPSPDLMLTAGGPMRAGLDRDSLLGFSGQVFPRCRTGVVVFLKLCAPGRSE